MSRTCRLIVLVFAMLYAAAFVLFLIVRSYNRMARKETEAPAAPPEPSAEEKLLAEICDLLKDRE